LLDPPGEALEKSARIEELPGEHRHAVDAPGHAICVAPGRVERGQRELVDRATEGTELGNEPFNTTMASETGFVDGLLAVGELVVLEWGFAMWVGSIPLAALVGWIGYRFSLRFVIAYRMARARRLANGGGLSQSGRLCRRVRFSSVTAGQEREGTRWRARRRPRRQRVRAKQAGSSHAF
jgi:hypothetical protein